MVVSNLWNRTTLGVDCELGAQCWPPCAKHNSLFQLVEDDLSRFLCSIRAVDDLSQLDSHTQLSSCPSHHGQDFPKNVTSQLKQNFFCVCFQCPVRVRTTPYLSSLLLFLANITGSFYFSKIFWRSEPVAEHEISLTRKAKSEKAEAW